MHVILRVVKQHRSRAAVAGQLSGETGMKLI